MLCTQCMRISRTYLETYEKMRLSVSTLKVAILLVVTHLIIIWIILSKNHRISNYYYHLWQTFPVSPVSFWSMGNQPSEKLRNKSSKLFIIFSGALTVAVAIGNIVVIVNSYMKHIRIWVTSLIFLTNKATDSKFILTPGISNSEHHWLLREVLSVKSLYRLWDGMKLDLMDSMRIWLRFRYVKFKVD